MRIIIDAMGGDYAPEEIIKGTAQAVKASDAHLCWLAIKTVSHVLQWKTEYRQIVTPLCMHQM